MRDTVVAALCGGAFAVLIFYFGFRVGRKAGKEDRLDAALEEALARLDPEGKAGRLPSEIDEPPATGRHHKAPNDPTPPGGFSLPLGPRHDSASATDRFLPLAADALEDSPAVWRPSPHPRTEVIAP